MASSPRSVIEATLEGDLEEMNQDLQPISVRWSPLRPSGLVIAALVAVPIATRNLGLAGFVLGLLLFILAVTLSLKGVSKLEGAQRDGIVVRLGSFELTSRYVPREVALLQSHRSLLSRSLRIDRKEAPIIGPFLSVWMYDVWPEDDLRRAGYRFVDRRFRPEAL